MVLKRLNSDQDLLLNVGVQKVVGDRVVDGVVMVDCDIRVTGRHAKPLYPVSHIVWSPWSREDVDDTEERREVPGNARVDDPASPTQRGRSAGCLGP